MAATERGYCNYYIVVNNRKIYKGEKAREPMENPTERPEIPKRIILAMTRKREDFLSDTHHGAVESPLSKFYPFLNLDEVVAFEAQSWRIRGELPTLIEKYAESNDIYSVFNFVFGEGGGMKRLNATKKIDETDKLLYDSLNPFKGSLRDRVEQAPSIAKEELRTALQRPVRRYKSESKVYAMHRDRSRPDVSNVVALTFLPYTFKGKTQQIINGYANKIAELLSAYPRGYTPLEPPQRNLF